jgi:hypothetical protein
MNEKADDNVIVWEFACSCGSDLEVPATEIDFSPTSLVKPDCPDCGEMMRHVGPVLDVCDECGQELLYRGCQGLGYSTVCERCYERMAEVVPPRGVRR